jgi:hypothetical protein
MLVRSGVRRRLLPATMTALGVATVAAGAPFLVGRGGSTAPPEATAPMTSGPAPASSGPPPPRRAVNRADRSRTAPAPAARLPWSRDRVGHEALAGLPYDVAATGFTVAFLPARSGLRGQTLVDARQIQIYVRDGESATSIRRILAHELGHAVDLSRNTDQDRARWLARRGAPEQAWWPSPYLSDFASGAGDFAEVFARWLVGTGDFRSRLAPAPAPDELARLAAGWFGARTR